jgi:hypothetical protein
MKRSTFGFLAMLPLIAAQPAHAASDYLLEIEGVAGEAAGAIEVNSWSWGASNPTSVGSGGMSAGRVVSPRDAASGQSTGRSAQGDVRVTASQNTQSLRESPTRASTGRVAGDLDGDGRADLAAISNQAELQSFTLTFDQSSPALARVCSGKHLAKASLRGRGDEFVVENATVSCTQTSPSAAAARDSMPNRISMNVTTPKQTQGATFGERCAAGVCTAGAVTMTFTGGQMRHTKTGHVTLLK